MLMSAASRGIDADHAPVDPAFSVSISVSVGLDSPRDSLPRSVRRTFSMTVVNRLPPARMGRPKAELTLSDRSGVC